MLNIVSLKFIFDLLHMALNTSFVLLSEIVAVPERNVYRFVNDSTNLHKPNVEHFAVM